MSLSRSALLSAIADIQAGHSLNLKDPIAIPDSIRLFFLVTDWDSDDFSVRELQFEASIWHSGSTNDSLAKQ